jgi:ribokinase
MTGMSGVLVAGAINTDLVATVQHAPRQGETVTGTGFAVFGGGKGANQAVAVARSGGSVRLVGAVGDDQFGRDRLTELEADGMDVSTVEIVAEATSGVALILVEESGDNRIAYIPGATGSIAPDRVIEAYKAQRPAVVLAPNELPTAALRTLFAEAARDGATTILNATPDPQTVIDMLGSVSILIVNEHEAVEILGSSVEGYGEAALELGRRHGLRVVVTAGEAGAFLWDGTEVVHVQGPQVNPVDTTGAGDTFCGALACELERGSNLTQAARFAVHAAGLSVTRAGAQSSIPLRDDVLADMARA